MSKKRLKLKKSTIPKYENGGFMDNAGQFVGNWGKGIADMALTTVGASDVIQDSAYSGTGSKLFKNYANVAGKLGQTGLQIGATALGGPMAGMAVGAAQKGIGQATARPEQPMSQFSAQPMVDQTQINDPGNYFEKGGMTKENLIEVQGKEYEVQDGRITKDFKKQPTHAKGGYTYDAPQDRVIIPAKYRQRYAEGGKTTRNSIEANVVNDQIKRENRFEKYAKGGLTRQGDYGSSAKPYPDVNRKDFAGSGRSYPIPTKDDAVDALRLAGLHGREDIRTKVFKRYPELKKGEGGATNAFNARKAEFGLSTGTEVQLPQASYWDGMNPLALGDEMSYNLPRNRQYNQVGVNVTPDNQMEMKDYSTEPQVQPSFQSFNKKADTRVQNNLFGNSTPSYKKTTELDFTPKTGESNEFGVNDALQLTPIAYNAARGLFGKAQQLNQEEYQNPYEAETRRLMKNRQVDFKPISDEIRDTYRGGLKNIGAGQKSSGAVLSGKTGLYGAKMGALAKARMNADIANQGFRGEEASTLANLGRDRARTKLGITDYNARAMAAKNSYTGQAAQDLGEYGQFNNINEIGYNLAEQVYPNLKYDRKTKRYKTV